MLPGKIKKRRVGNKIFKNKVGAFLYIYQNINTNVIGKNWPTNQCNRMYSY
jgi:hypothetical protein